MSTEQASTQTDRTTVKRIGERGQYDRETIDEILDEAVLCHVGTVEDGTPMVIPTLIARIGDHVILHGSPASRMLRSAKMQEICVTVTLVDGYVLARSALHHSMNYRSVVILGTPEVVPTEEKAAALDALVEHLTPGRLPYLREMTEKEVKATAILRLAITEASAKVRTGPPSDDEEDYDLPIWSGVLPVKTAFGSAETDPGMRSEQPIPEHVTNFGGANGSMVRYED